MKFKCANRKEVWDSVMRVVTRYAERGPYFLNPDEVVVRNIVSGLAKNKIQYGYAYCPCREVEGIPEKNRKNICPCQTHKTDLARHGTCECGLFVSEAFLKAKQKE